MKIAVCLKSVPDTETRVKVAAGGQQISLDGVSFIMSPYDEFAMEEALQVKEKLGDGEVLVISAGGDETQEVLRGGFALGADRAIQIKDAALRTQDPFDVARVLARVLEQEGVNLAFFGKQGVGQDNAQVPALVAGLLGWSQASVVTGLEVQGGQVVATREIEGGEEVLECSLPAVVSAQKGLNTPRYPSIKGKMAAKKKTIEEKSLSALGLAPAADASWEVVKVELPADRPAGRLIEGEPEDQVKQLVQLLRNEANVI